MARFGRSRRQSTAIGKVPHMVEHHKEDHKTTPSIQRIQPHPSGSISTRLKRTSLRVPISTAL